jgi:uncharacterized membrane protein YkvA (DUF1232 family)
MVNDEITKVSSEQDINDQIDEKKLKFYEILRRRISRFVALHTGNKANKFTDYLLALPDFFILLCRLAADKRVTSSQKLFIGGIITYVILPIDIIPDFIPIIGYVDDLVLVVYGLNLILNELDNKILIDNWSGGEDVLDLLQKITVTAENFLDKNIMKKIQRWLSGLKK